MSNESFQIAQLDNLKKLGKAAGVDTSDISKAQEAQRQLEQAAKKFGKKEETPAVAASAQEVKFGEKTDLAAALEKFAAENGIKGVTANGALTLLEAKSIKGFIDKNLPEIKAGVAVSAKGITFTADALTAMGIEQKQPAKTQAAPAPQEAPVASDAADRGRAAAEATGKKMGEVGQGALDAVKAFGKKLGQGQLSECTAEQEVNGDTANCKPRGSGPTR